MAGNGGRLEDYISEIDNNVKEKMSKNTSVVEEQPESSLENETILTQSEAPIVEQQAEAVIEHTNVVQLGEAPIEVVNDTKGIDENSVLSFLSERLGRKIESIDELTKSEQRKLNPVVDSMQKWMDETGHDNPMIWYKTQGTDYAKLDDKTVIIEDYVVNKGLTPEQAELYYERTYGDEAIDEDLLSEAEVTKMQRLNKVKEIDRQLAAKESRERFIKLRDAYSVPKEGYNPNARSAENAAKITEDAKLFWQKNAQTASEQIKEMVIPIGNNKGYKMALGEYTKQNSAEFSDVEKFFGKFINPETKAWDVQKLIKAATLYDNIDVIAKSIYTQGISDGSKNVVASGKNLNFDSTEKSTPDQRKTSQLEEKVQRDLNAIKQRLNGGGVRF